MRSDSASPASAASSSRIPRLHEVRALKAGEELHRLRSQFLGCRSRREATEELKRKQEESDRTFEAQRRARLEVERRRREAAVRIQATVRRHFARRLVVPIQEDVRLRRELRSCRAELKDTMLSLRRSVYGLRFTEQERLAAATRIQAWWRHLVAKRVVAVIRLRRRVLEVHERMRRAASYIQALHRGQVARAGCKTLRLRKLEREARELRRQEEEMHVMAIRIQSVMRGQKDRKAVDRMRTERAKELEEDEEVQRTRTMRRIASLKGRGGHGRGGRGGSQKAGRRVASRLP